MKCRATLEIPGNVVQCELDAPHSGLAHRNDEVLALWCSDGEAKRYGKKAEAKA